MPNVKIFVDEELYPLRKAALAEAVPVLRAILCRELDVQVAACQFAVLPVMAPPDQPRVNVELHILPKAERTRERLLALCDVLQQTVAASVDSPVAVRIFTLDPAIYIALK